MSHLLGIDLGTSSVKAVIVDESGSVNGVGVCEYPIESPQPGWAEQDPDRWWDATVVAVRAATAQAQHTAVMGVGFSGQMHGTVLIDAAKRPIGNAIIWPDQRSTGEVTEILDRVGPERMATIAGTAPATGFMGPTLLWLLHNEPRRLERTYAALFPKDYLRLRLTGEIAGEPSDGSSSALFDVRKRIWSTDIISALNLPTAILPPLLEPTAVAGELYSAPAAALGLTPGIPVVAGCADQVAQAVSNGLVRPGYGSVTVGSGGQILLPLDRPTTDAKLRLHTFCHAPADRWYLLGAILSAGLSLRWLRDLLDLTADVRAYDALAAQAARVAPGCDGLLFLPYLAGERSPIMDPLARGSFVGLTLRHARAHLARAIMEGVAFALRQVLESMTELNVPADRMLAVGNGLASPVWRQIVADVLGRPLLLPVGQEKTGVGAALLAGIGAGVYADYAAALQVIQAPTAVTEPSSELATLYTEQYGRYLAIYPALRDLLHGLSRASGQV